MQQVKESKKFKYKAGKAILHMDRAMIYPKKFQAAIRKGDVIEITGNYDNYKKNKNWELVTDKKTNNKEKT